jgi:hypothetical protein
VEIKDNSMKIGNVDIDWWVLAKSVFDVIVVIAFMVMAVSVLAGFVVWVSPVIFFMTIFGLMIGGLLWIIVLERYRTRMWNKKSKRDRQVDEGL